MSTCHEYPKIQSMFKREGQKAKHVTKWDWTHPEFEMLKRIQWIGTEKIDGTNMRVSTSTSPGFPTGGITNVHFMGRTANAQIPTFLLMELQKLFPVEKIREVFDHDEFTLYGEGYGPKIQKGGGRYRSDHTSFILFDVRIGDLWLERENVEDIANKLGIDVVPIRYVGNLIDAVYQVEEGFFSEIAEDTTYIAEGLVLRPKVELQTRRGDRIITKIKYNDFPHGE